MSGYHTHRRLKTGASEQFGSDILLVKPKTKGVHNDQEGHGGLQGPVAEHSAATVSLFFVSVIMMNLLANKELISLPYLALDCGFVVSWVSFLCQDMICKRFGAKASIKISILALLVNLAVSLCFWACSLTPGMWGAYYDTGMIEVNTALNATIGGTWYVVLGSSLAMLVLPWLTPRSTNRSAVCSKRITLRALPSVPMCLRVLASLSTTWSLPLW